jgi:hypothetical protein
MKEHRMVTVKGHKPRPRVILEHLPEKRWKKGGKVLARPMPKNDTEVEEDVALRNPVQGQRCRDPQQTLLRYSASLGICMSWKLR